MKVILQKDVKDIGKVGDVVKVSEGFARNFLFPRKLALIATEGKVKQWEHTKKVIEAKKRAVHAERQALVSKINGLAVVIKATAGESDKLFGSITTTDISKVLTTMGHQVDRKDIHLDEHIKVLGNHKATIKFGEGLTANIQVVVERM
jgi:large subunit ribosomal protein L9